MPAKGNSQRNKLTWNRLFSNIGGGLFYLDVLKGLIFQKVFNPEKETVL
jgi:hypothetical protein